MRRLTCVWLSVIALLLGEAGWGAAPEIHRFKFFIHPDLAQGLTLADLGTRLALYVEDLNTIFAKQTLRVFQFSPGSDLTLTTNGFFTGNYVGTLPETGFELWAQVLPSELPDYGTYGGYATLDASGAGVVAGLRWDAVHDRSVLMTGSGMWELQQYWRQVHELTHELEHIFGAGLGEYYSLREVDDFTQTPPILNLHFDDHPESDSYWARHPDFYTDPLTLWTPDLSYAELMAQVRFAEVTAAVINAHVRGGIASTLPDLQRTAVRVRDAGGGQPIAGARVLVWKVQSSAPFTSQVVVDALSDAEGRVPFPWDGAFDNLNQLILIKGFAPGAHRPAARWASIYEAQETKMVNGFNTFEIPLDMARPVRLSLEPTGDGVALFWPADAPDAVLQATADPVAGPWETVAEPVTTVGPDKVVLLTAGPPARFFRLLLPP